MRSTASRHDVIPRRRDCCYGYSGRQVDAATAAVDIRAQTRREAAAAAEEFYFRWSRGPRRELVLGYHSMPPERRSPAHAHRSEVTRSRSSSRGKMIIANTDGAYVR